MSPDAALAVCRFLHDASAMLLWGASAFLAALVPPILARETGRRLFSLLVVAGVIAIVTTGATLPLESAAIGSGWSNAISPTTLRAVLFETSVGQAWQMRAVASLILLAALLIARRRGLIAGAAGLLLASLALTGHAVMWEGWPGVAQQINDAVHILTAGAWVGALVPLLIIVRLLDTAELRVEALVALRRFSTVGQAIVALAIASGVINTFLILGRWPTDWTSPYQAMLATKIALVAVMVGLALNNGYRLAPKILNQPQQSARDIRVCTLAEIALALCVIALVSAFGMLEPM